MKTKFGKLFESTNIGKVGIKNRIAMSPMLPLGLYRDGIIPARTVDYYVERAKGGAGLIITGVFKVENDAEPAPIPYYPMVNLKGYGPLAELSDYVHAYGARIFIQLTAGTGRLIPPELIDEFGFKPVSASVNQAFYRPQVSTRALSTEDVEKLARSFGRATQLIVAAEIDGIELHGHQGYLFDQFTTSLWNKRTDKYGGDLDGRLTLPIEVLQNIKDAAGKSFPVTYRFGLKHYLKTPERGTLKQDSVEVGRDIEEGLEMARRLETAGFDALHVDAGCYESQYYPHPPMYQPHGCTIDLISKVKKVVSIPILAVGKLDIPELAEQVLEEGKADIIALGRGLLADPYWPQKVREGRIDDIRPCIGCHEGCMMRSSVSESLGRPFTCSVNPACGREKLFKISSADKAKNILIVGGGAAGMECTRVSTLRGHKITLCEKSSRLGGHLIEASIPEFKDDVRRLLEWYEGQLKKLNVNTRLNTIVIPEFVKKEEWDAVVVATGSTHLIPAIAGVDRENVVTCGDLLLGNRKAGDNVVIIGGGSEGCETAVWLAKQGKRVTIIEMLSQVAADLWESNHMMLMEMLEENGVKILTNTSVQEVTDGSVVTVDKKSQRNLIKCDTVALATGLKPRKELYEALSNDVTELYLIGDCKEPHKIHQAIWDGFNIGLSI
jgi:2-enoate reductase